MFKVLFVCTGNTCRSSMAEELLKSILKNHNIEDKIHISSSGTEVDVSLPASDNAIAALKELELDLTKHRSKLVTRELIDEMDLVLAMTEAHKDYILKIMPEAKEKIFTLIEYASGEKGDIADPYRMDLETYRKCRDDILKYLEMVLEKIKRKA